MMDETVSVIVVSEGVVESATLFIGQKDKISAAAESFFLEKCRDHISNWDEHDHNDIGAILEDGYYQNVSGTWSVNIVWPETRVISPYGLGWRLNYTELCQLAGLSLGGNLSQAEVTKAFNMSNKMRLTVREIGSGYWEITSMGS